MLSRVAHVVPLAPGVLPAAGMTYVSLICAASGSERSVRRRETMMYREAFTVKTFPGTGNDGNGRAGEGIPGVGGRRCDVLRPFAFPARRSPLPACRERYQVPSRGAREDLSRTGDLLVGVLQHFLPLGEPAGDAGD